MEFIFKAVVVPILVGVAIKLISDWLDKKDDK